MGECVDGIGHAGFPDRSRRRATPDPDDEMILECALAAEADYIVSGDKRHLLALRQFRGIPIVGPADFRRRLKETAVHGKSGGGMAVPSEQVGASPTLPKW